MAHRSELIVKALMAGIKAMLFYSPYAAVNGSSSRKHPKCTFPVQKGPCIVFKHPTGHELEKANKANIEFNKGVEAGSEAKFYFI
jgi:hypothetical protein